MKHVQTCGVKAHQVSWCCSAKTSNDKDIIQTGYHGLQLAIADKMCGLEGWITRRMAFHVAAVQRSAMTKMAYEAHSLQSSDAEKRRRAESVDSKTHGVLCCCRAKTSNEKDGISSSQPAVLQCKENLQS